MFKPGGLYNRQRDIHARFGGQRRGGISTPTEEPYIFLFTGESGESFGYKDGWADDGIYRYTGEGQVGDMEFSGGNKAIRDHALNGKDVLLFQSLGKGKPIRFVGRFACQDWEIERRPDRLGNERNALIFLLAAVEFVEAEESLPAVPAISGEHESIAALRARAYQLATLKTLSKEARKSQNVYQRSLAVRDYVLARAAGYCEGCRCKAPFSRSSGEPYLEPHHTRRMSDGGPDHPRWVVALCPNCHRHVHYGLNGNDMNERLQSHLGDLEAD